MGFAAERPEAERPGHHAFDYGPAHFVVLDSQAEAKIAWRHFGAQKPWLKPTGGQQGEWVVFHKPPYLVINTEQRRQRSVCPIMERCGVDLVFNAHTRMGGPTYQSGVYER
jgi:hypothetical protein